MEKNPRSEHACINGVTTKESKASFALPIYAGVYNTDLSKIIRPLYAELINEEMTRFYNA